MRERENIFFFFPREGRVIIDRNRKSIFTKNFDLELLSFKIRFGWNSDPDPKSGASKNCYESLYEPFITITFFGSIAKCCNRLVVK